MVEFQEFADQPSDNTYIIDSESAAEMARLMRQDHLMTQEMGGLFPKNIDLSNMDHILDIACGPGGWVLEMAFTHADIDVVGVDISQNMIAYAQAQARVQGLTNASFQIMDARQPLDFPDQSFNLVNARFIVGFMPRDSWACFVQECLRILKPGGILCLTESEWGGFNKGAFGKICELFNRSLMKSGQSFSPGGLHVGIIPMLAPFLRGADCVNVHLNAHAIEFSYGTEAHEGFLYDLTAGLKLGQPFIMRWAAIAAEEYDKLYQQALLDMQSEDFCALSIVVTVFGYKPGGEEE